MLMIKSLCGVLFLFGVIIMSVSLWQLRYKYCANHVNSEEITENIFNHSVSVMNTFLGCMLIGVAGLTLCI